MDIRGGLLVSKAHNCNYVHIISNSVEIVTMTHPVNGLLASEAHNCNYVHMISYSVGIVTIMCF